MASLNSRNRKRKEARIRVRAPARPGPIAVSNRTMQDLYCRWNTSSAAILIDRLYDRIRPIRRVLLQSAERINSQLINWLRDDKSPLSRFGRGTPSSSRASTAMGRGTRPPNIWTWDTITSVPQIFEELSCPYSLISWRFISPKWIFGSRPSDHYFRSVCLFVCLFVCPEFFSACLIRFRSNLDICCMSGSSCVP